MTFQVCCKCCQVHRHEATEHVAKCAEEAQSQKSINNGPIHSIRDQNSRIGSQAADLPEYAGSVFTPELPGRLT